LPEIGGNVAYYFENFDKESMKTIFKAGMQDYFINNRKSLIQERAKFFSWANAAKQYVEIYKML